ncbi:hypothetical protein BDP81DRAFT_495966 [Colletotrichum phormii]|uniref:DUF7702 domain-containing protein n=1 Tax=Colletotrichum phormii TaxID=359342 RepID=A0AAJ0EBF8_9PEZI|nr:uncharacterized protein BDP81DRAFT_495966 [Colletotrichum phormii]KAK1625561.1 hypothetical protein BDP81DRAFT_495966 [Colletotrichum phormii]
MAEAAAHNFPPVSREVVNLAIAELVLYGLMFPAAVWITWKHGKKGMVCWPIFVSHFGMRFIADIHQVIKRDEPLLPNQFNIMTSAGSLACLSLTLIGIVYEAVFCSNIILPGSRKRWTEKIILGVTHLTNTAGIGMATYGGSPSHEGGLINNSLNQIGNCLELFVMFAVFAWLWPTYKKIRSSSSPNCRPAMLMIRAAVVGLPFQLIHLAYTTTYAFNQISSLDPIMGSFATKLVLIFGTYLGVTIAMLAGGWLGMSADMPKAVQVELTSNDVEGNNNLVRDDISLTRDWSRDDIARAKQGFV